MAVNTVDVTVACACLKHLLTVNLSSNMSCLLFLNAKLCLLNTKHALSKTSLVGLDVGESHQYNIHRKWHTPLYCYVSVYIIHGSCHRPDIKISQAMYRAKDGYIHLFYFI